MEHQETQQRVREMTFNKFDSERRWVGGGVHSNGREKKGRVFLSILFCFLLKTGET